MLGKSSMATLLGRLWRQLCYWLHLLIDRWYRWRQDVTTWRGILVCELLECRRLLSGYTFSAQQETDIVAGMNVLETAWDNLSTVGDLTDNMSLLGGSSLGSLFDLDQQLNNGLITPSAL